MAGGLRHSTGDILDTAIKVIRVVDAVASGQRTL
jgi:hypothetical protein